MKSFKEYLTGRGGYRFREIINELTDDELEHRINDFVIQQFEFLNLPVVSGSVCDFIEWINKYHIKKQKLNNEEMWVSGSKYWRFNNIDEMYKYYLEHYR